MRFEYGVTKEHKSGGYPRMSCGPERNTFVHILVAQAMLRRELRPDETIHHKDGNTKNPHWKNLIVLDKSVHDAVSNRQYWYLKQKYSAEKAAYWAYFDITNETYEEYDRRIAAEVSFNPEEFIPFTTEQAEKHCDLSDNTTN